MRVAALYDVHGNLPALDAVLAEVRREGIETIVAGGDVLWGPFQAECLDALRAADAIFVSGNCERDVLGLDDDSCRWCREQLGPDDRAAVGAWPSTVELDVDGLGRILFCHATPRSDEEILTSRTPDEDVATALVGVMADVVVCGHTHVQQDRHVSGAPRLVNAGSVGLPYQGRDGAYWAALGPAVELRRTEYAVESALSALCASSFPSVEEIFTEALRGQVSAQSATEHFEAKRRGA